jgi:hypothetical protein
MPDPIVVPLSPDFSVKFYLKYVVGTKKNAQGLIKYNNKAE